MRLRNIIICMVSALSVSCSPRIIYRDVPVISERVDTIVKKETVTNEVIRTIEVRDSVVEKQKGDTVYRDHWRIERDYTYEKNLQSTIDSLLSIRRDTVSVPYPVEVEVAGKSGPFHIGIMFLGWITFACMCLLGLLICFRIYKGRPFVG